MTDKITISDIIELNGQPVKVSNVTIEGSGCSPAWDGASEAAWWNAVPKGLPRCDWRKAMRITLGHHLPKRLRGKG